MAGLPEMFPEFPSTFPKVPSMVPGFPGALPSTLRAPRYRSSHSRTSSPPAPMLYLKGFSCIASDPEYQHARLVTGNAQPYWFEESYGPSDYYGLAQRRTRHETTRRDNKVADIHLDDSTNEKDTRATKEKKKKREKERDLFVERMWPVVKEEYASLFDMTNISPEEQADMKNDMVMILRDQWKQEEKERIAEKQKKKKQEEQIQRLPLRNYMASLQASQQKFKMKSKPKTDVGGEDMNDERETKEDEDEDEGLRRRLSLVLRAPPTSPHNPTIPPPTDDNEVDDPDANPDAQNESMEWASDPPFHQIL